MTNPSDRKRHLKEQQSWWFCKLTINSQVLKSAWFTQWI